MRPLQNDELRMLVPEGVGFGKIWKMICWLAGRCCGSLMPQMSKLGGGDYADAMVGRHFGEIKSYE